MYLFQRFHILDIIDRIWENFEENTSSVIDKNPDNNTDIQKKEILKKNIRYDRIFAKASSYYVFLVFFRYSIVIVGVTEVEKFMQDIINYLPSLFIGIMI